MTRSRVFAVVALIAVLLIGLTACGVNSIPRAEENGQGEMGRGPGRLSAPADTLPNLVRTARAAAAQERNVPGEATRGARRRRRRINVTARAAHRSGGDAALRRGPGAAHHLAAAPPGSLAELNETDQNCPTLQSQIEGHQEPDHDRDARL